MARDQGAKRPSARRRLHAAIDARQPAARFGELLALLFVTFFFVGSAPFHEGWVPFVAVLIESATLLVALFASGARGWVVTGSIFIIFFGVISTLFAWVLNEPHVDKAASLITVLLVLVAPLVVVRGLARRRTIDLRTVLGALSLYMMAGLFFTSVYSAIQTWSHTPFFAQTHTAGPPDFLYFSFITLTTVGFGDLTAASQFGRTTSAFEAIFGQFYLVTVVAVLVSNMGPAFRYRRAKQQGASDDEAVASQLEADGLGDAGLAQSATGQPATHAASETDVASETREDQS
jgi:hypothetical protein